MTRRLKVTRGSDNVFADLGFSGEEAENLLLRAQVMSRIVELARGESQREAARKFGVSQPRLNDLVRGKIDKFSLDALVNMLAHAGMRVELKVTSTKPFASFSRTLQRLKAEGRKPASERFEVPRSGPPRPIELGERVARYRTRKRSSP